MVVPGIKTAMSEKKTPAAEKYEKCLETVAEQFRIMEVAFSPGIRASWLQEVEHLLNQAKADLQDS